MERGRAKSIGGRLFDPESRLNISDYLAFLAERVPSDLEDRILDDAQPDISMPSQTVTVTDIVRPLSSGELPVANLARLTGLLGYLVIGYDIRLSKGNCDDTRLSADHRQSADNDNVYKFLYVASLYLYCFVRGGGVPPASGYLHGIRVMALTAMKLDVQSRLAVCRFIAFLVPMLPCGSTDEPAPLSNLLFLLSLVIGSILGDMAPLLKNTSASEELVREWEEEAGDVVTQTACQGITPMKEVVLQVLGPCGNVKRGLDDILMILSEDKTQT